jgi:hypothetical protein
MVGAAAPAMPHNVLEWFAARGTSFAGGGDEAGMHEPAFAVYRRAPWQLSHTCAFCGGLFEAKRRDAKFCSTRCQVAAHRARANKELEPSA